MGITHEEAKEIARELRELHGTGARREIDRVPRKACGLKVLDLRG